MASTNTINNNNPLLSNLDIIFRVLSFIPYRLQFIATHSQQNHAPVHFKMSHVCSSWREVVTDYCVAVNPIRKAIAIEPAKSYLVSALLSHPFVQRTPWIVETLLRTEAEIELSLEREVDLFETIVRERNASSSSSSATNPLIVRGARLHLGFSYEEEEDDDDEYLIDDEVDNEDGDAQQRHRAFLQSFYQPRATLQRTVTAFPHLNNLYIGYTDKIQTDDLRLIGSQLLQLERLDVSQCSVTDEGLKALFEANPVALAKRMTFLNLAGTSISNEGLSSVVTKLVGLETLSVANTPISDFGEDLQNLSQLKHLDVRYTKFNDDAMKHVATLRMLETINLQSTLVTIHGLIALVKLPFFRVTPDFTFNSGVNDEQLRSFEDMLSERDNAK